jgi:hypothetical protein
VNEVVFDDAVLLSEYERNGFASWLILEIKLHANAMELWIVFQFNILCEFISKLFNFFIFFQSIKK